MNPVVQFRQRWEAFGTGICRPDDKTPLGAAFLFLSRAHPRGQSERVVCERPRFSGPVEPSIIPAQVTCACRRSQNARRAIHNRNGFRPPDLDPPNRLVQKLLHYPLSHLAVAGPRDLEKRAAMNKTLLNRKVSTKSSLVFSFFILVAFGDSLQPKRANRYVFREKSGWHFLRRFVRFSNLVLGPE